MAVECYLGIRWSVGSLIELSLKDYWAIHKIERNLYYGTSHGTMGENIVAVGRKTKYAIYGSYYDARNVLPNSCLGVSKLPSSCGRYDYGEVFSLFSTQTLLPFVQHWPVIPAADSASRCNITSYAAAQAAYIFDLDDVHAANEKTKSGAANVGESVGGSLGWQSFVSTAEKNIVGNPSDSRLVLKKRYLISAYSLPPYRPYYNSNRFL